jgi:hypothetical protein
MDLHSLGTPRLRTDGLCSLCNREIAMDALRLILRADGKLWVYCPRCEAEMLATLEAAASGR